METVKIKHIPIRRDISGLKIYMLTAIKRVIDEDRKHINYWLFNCECGSRKVIDVRCVSRGLTKSCGCYAKSVSSQLNMIHGHSKDPMYRIWINMKDRCTNIKHKYYKYYGGSGIEICSRWLNSIDSFIDDMGPRPSPKHSIDRINNKYGYSKNNCRWVTMKTQSRNRRNTIYVNHKGISKPFIDVCDLLGIDYYKVRRHLYEKKLTPEEVINKYSQL